MLWRKTKKNIIDIWFENHSTMSENDYNFIKKLEQQLEKDKKQIKNLSSKEKKYKTNQNF